tara:strand:- start:53441 stop:54277 length:837 start_codon:yes stop_codon:yes gene_type:complete
MNKLNKFLKTIILITSFLFIGVNVSAQSISSTYYNQGYLGMKNHLEKNNFGKLTSDYYQIYVDKFLRSCSNVKTAYNGTVNVYNPGDPRLPQSACHFTLGAKDALGRYLNANYQLSSPSACERSAVPANDPAVSSQYNKTDTININWSQCSNEINQKCTSQTFNLTAGSSFPVRIVMPEMLEGTKAYEVEALEQGQECKSSQQIYGNTINYKVNCKMNAECTNGSWKALNTTCECEGQSTGVAADCCGPNASWKCKAAGCGCYMDNKPLGNQYPKACP